MITKPNLMLKAVDGNIQTAAEPCSATLGVLILGGRPLDHAGLRGMIAAAEGMRALEAKPSHDPLTAAPHERPDVILLDVGSADCGADALVAETCSAWKPAPVLVVVDSGDSVRARQLVRAGARGVVGKTHAAAELLKAIRKVEAGELWLDRLSLTRLIDEIAGQVPVSDPNGAQITSLTTRERAVLDLVAQGFSNKAIGKQLAITDSTVRHHLTSIFAKVRVTDRLGLAVYAFRHRSGRLNSPAE